jgi:amino acid transporter
MQTRKIGLLKALIINIGIMIGAGVFVNIRPITILAGNLSFLSYILSALILFPFVYTLSILARDNPVQGGLYFYSHKYLSPFVGFLSGWCYFVGKTVSAAFLAYIFTSFIQSHIPTLHNISTLLLTCFTIFAIALINVAGAQIGGSIQIFFISAKAIPVISIITFGIIHFSSVDPAATPSISSLLSSIPSAIYAFMGFEIICAIAHMIENPQKNVFRAITGSFLIVALIFTTFQFVVTMALGKSILSESLSLAEVIEQLFSSWPVLGKVVTSLMYTSVIAGAFGLLTSNCWNLFTLAEHKHFFKSKPLLFVTKKGVPVISLLLECSLACLILLISKDQLALQSMSVFGVVLSFVLSAVAAFKSNRSLISLISIGSCIYVLFLCYQKMQAVGVSIPYLLFILGGIIFAIISKTMNKEGV